MQKFLIAVAILFIALTFVGAGYVIANHGEVNAGYAVIPMVCAIASLAALKSLKKKT